MFPLRVTITFDQHVVNAFPPDPLNGFEIGDGPAFIQDVLIVNDFEIVVEMNSTFSVGDTWTLNAADWLTFESGDIPATPQTGEVTQFP